MPNPFDQFDAPELPDDTRTFYDGVRNAISPLGGRITSTNGGRHNPGSAHYRGRAVDVGMGRETPEQQEAIKAGLEAAGYRVRDERTRPAGQAVWGGPHLHVSMPDALAPTMASAMPLPPPRPAETEGLAASSLLGIGAANAGEMPAGDNPFDQFDAPAPAAAPPGYIDTVGGALQNVFTGDGSLIDRVGALHHAVTPDLFRGIQSRAAGLAGSVVRGIANVAEPIGDTLETYVPLSGLTPEQLQNERQLQPMYDLADTLGEFAKVNEYQPTVSFQDVKNDPLSLATPTFIGEQAAISIPDMAASVFALPAYVLGRTEEIAEKRVQNDAAPSLSDLITGAQPTVAPGTEPGLGDLAAAAPGALVESLLERYATHRLPGAAPGGSMAGNILREAGVQAGTEALEEGAANLGESLGTRRGVQGGELADAMLAGGLVGGGLGAGVRAGTEAVDAVRGVPSAVEAPQVVNPFDQFDAPAAEAAPSDAIQIDNAGLAPAAPDAAAAPAEPNVGAPAEPETAPAEPQPATTTQAAAAPELPAPIDVATPQVAEAEAVVAPPAPAPAPDPAIQQPAAAAAPVTEPADLAGAEPAPVAEAPARRVEEVEAARILELRQKRRQAPLTPQESTELVDLMERDAHAAKVAGRRIAGVQNMAARAELEQAGGLKPVQAFADADDFKSFNDQMGHETGDTVIRTLGQEFASALGEGNVFHRGGDEFVLQADSPEQMAAAMEAVRSRLAQAEFVMTTADGQVITRQGVGFSYGVGPTEQEAESAQSRDKQDRKAAGLRVGARDAAPAVADRSDPADRAADRPEGGEGRASDAGRAPEAVAPALEDRINDRPAVSDERSNEPTSGSRAPAREAAELEDRREGADAAESTRKGDTPEFTRASFTNRRSWAQDAYRAAGLDPDAAELLPVAKQFEAVGRALKDKFGITAKMGDLAHGRMAVDQVLDLYRNAQTMAHVLGMPEKAVGLGDSLTLLLRGQTPYLGAMYPGGGKIEGVDLPPGAIALPRRSNSFAHEWGHALDLHLTSKYGFPADGKLLTKKIRAEGIDFQPNTSQEAFVRLLDNLFYDQAALAAQVMALQQAASNGTPAQQARAKQALERLARGNSHIKRQGTEYLIDSRSFGRDVGGKGGADYFADPAEMLARAFEAYVAERVESAGGDVSVLAKGDSAYLSNADDRFARTFPKLDERLGIFAAFDDLFGQLSKEQLIAQGVAANNPGNLDTFDPRQWLADPGTRPEHRGIMGALREQRDEIDAWRERNRREAARPQDPVTRKARVQNALMAYTTPIQGAIRVMERRYPQSRALKQLANKLVTDPGADRAVGRVYEQAVRITSGRNYNMFGNIAERYDLNRLNDADRQTLRRLLVSAQDPAGAKPKLVKAASELRRLMDTLWYDNQEADINLGYAKNGYLPRILDLAMVEKDPAGFIDAATEAYAINVAKDNPGMSAADVRERAEGMARSWLANINAAPAFDFSSDAPAAGYTKHRSLPAEADVLLEQFYVSDPLEVIHRYIGMSAKNTEFGKAFGPKGEQLNTLFRQMADEGVRLEDQKYLQGTVASLLGRSGGGFLDGKPRAQAMMNQINAYGVMSMLGRVLISSLAEPGMAGIRTGSAANVYKPYFNLIKQTVGSNDMRQWQQITRAIGLIGDAQADMVVQARLGGTYESTPKTDARLARYFAITGLHALTNAQRVSLMPITHDYLAELARDANAATFTSPAAAKEAAAQLRELGVSDIPSFTNWILDSGAARPTMTDLFDSNGQETTQGAAYMTAMSRLSEQIVQAPYRFDRPEAANSPGGRFFYGIMSFNMAFWNNVYKRQAKVIARQYAEGKGASTGPVGVAKGVGYASGHVGAHLAPPLIAYFFTQLLVTAVREALLNPQRWEEWDRDDELVPNLVRLTLSRAFPLGLFDPVIQAYQGLKYQRDLTGIAVGAVPSFFLGAGQKIINNFTDANSDKTNNAEFSAMQGAYQLIANPLIAHVLTSLPGGPIMSPVAGAALAYGTSAAARDKVATAVVGERDSLVAKRKRDERKALESQRGRGSGRGSVRKAARGETDR